jgi:heme exporter protein D
MNWGSAGEFFAMGGKGLYVWGSYAVTFLCVAMELLMLAGRRRRAARMNNQR